VKSQQRTTGTWLQPDPSGQNPGYVFNQDDPVNSTDPTGLFSISCSWWGNYTLYFNWRETTLLASFSGGAAGFLAGVPTIGLDFGGLCRNI